MTLVHLASGIDLEYQSRGEGPPVILIPGTGLPGAVWGLHQVPALSRDHQVITYDPRGCGGSTRYRGVYAMEQHAADVFALMDHLEIRRADVIGHSMGGRIALAMALLFPGRLNSIVLAASGSGPVAIPGRACVPGLPEQMTHDLAVQGLEGYVRREVFDTNAYFTEDFRAGNPEAVQGFWDVLWPGHAALPEFIGMCVGRHTWEATHRLGDVTVPTFVVVGDQDTHGRSHVPQARILASGIPGATFALLEGQSHGFFWQDPAAANDVVRRWLHRTES